MHWGAYDALQTLSRLGWGGVHPLLISLPVDTLGNETLNLAPLPHSVTTTEHRRRRPSYDTDLLID